MLGLEGHLVIWGSTDPLLDVQGRLMCLWGMFFVSKVIENVQNIGQRGRETGLTVYVLCGSQGI